MKQIKIGILGEIRAGKDTVANLLAKEIKKKGSKQPTIFFAFSQGIHDVIEMTMPELYEDGKPREALQGIGQELRKHKPDVWIDYLFNHHNFYLANFVQRNSIITDVRQPNEALRLQGEGYHIIKVTASEEVRTIRAKASGDNFTPEMLNHETEIVINQCPYDYLIDNSYSLDVLKDAVNAILEEVIANG